MVKITPYKNRESKMTTTKKYAGYVDHIGFKTDTVAAWVPFTKEEATLMEDGSLIPSGMNIDEQYNFLQTLFTTFLEEINTSLKSTDTIDFGSMQIRTSVASKSSDTPFSGTLLLTARVNRILQDDLDKSSEVE